jgi:hypothetical protein
MATPVHKLLSDYAQHVQRVKELKVILLKPETRKYYPPMNDDDWIKFCNTYPVDKKKKKKKKEEEDSNGKSSEEKKPAKKAKTREEVD